MGVVWARRIGRDLGRPRSGKVGQSVYLRRLEIQGFKSFPERTTLELGPGLTAVVGPNGSGKSNLADAIRWALGEQSARVLRGSRMDEVIFAGTERRRPLSMAEVRLTFDNAEGALPVDYAEITVTRRVTRDGESGYYLNGTPCRLKDVTDLLAGTGIGRDSYSLVSQGRIDHILSTRGEDRRELLEEAAGITRFRAQQRESSRRLEAAEKDLERLGDILHELEAQARPLSRQAEVAQAYREVATQLRELEVGSLLALVERAERRLTEGEDRRRELGEAVQAGELRLSAVESDRTATGAGLSAIEERLQEIRHLIMEQRAGEHELRARLEAGRRAHRDLQLQLAAAAERVASARIWGEEAAAEEAASSAVGAKSQQELNLARAGHELEQSRVASLRREAAAAGRAVEETKAELLDALNRAAALKHQVEAREMEGRHWEQQARRRAQEAADLAERMLLNQREVEGLARAREDQRGRQAESDRRAQEVRLERDALEKELEAARREAARARQRLETLHSRYTVLGDMLTQYEGYGRGPRAVLAAGIAGVLGPVADLMEIHAGYELAIAAALGGALQHIVTETETAAEESIAHLKRISGGRATFLPLSLIRPSQLSRQELEAIALQPGARPALEVVSGDERVMPALRHLLGRVVVAPDLERALEVGRATGLRLRIATLPGEVIAPGGAITGGGRAPEFSGVLGRRREWAALGEQLAAAEREASGWLDRERELTALRDDRERTLRGLVEELAALKVQVASVDQEWERARKEQARLASSRELGEAELDDTRRHIQQALVDGQAAAGLRQAAVEEVARLQALVKERSESYEHLRLSAESGQEALSELRARVVQLEQVELGASGRRQQARREVARAREELEKACGREAELREAQSATEHELTALTGRLERAGAGVDQLQEAQAAAEAARLEAATRLGQLEQEAKGLSRTLSQLRSRHHAEDLERARAELEAGHARAQLRERYELAPDSSTSGHRRYHPEESAAAIAQLKAKLASFGPVNLGAIDEFQRVSERRDFLAAQRADIESACRDLRRVIQETDGQMQSMFDATFAAVRSSFRQLFRRLFGGGSADLTLSDPSRPLDSGVEIDVQPPGRRPHNLSLLSGGEKALTASALLFAMLSINPSPLCILDEIEATLDEANAARFVSLLREFSSRTQFIIVTHHKTTMEASDVLYGVTMEENGVSRLISVRLADATDTGGFKGSVGVFPDRSG